MYPQYGIIIIVIIVNEVRNQTEIKIRVPEALKTKFAEYASIKRKSVSGLIRNYMKKELTK